MHAPGNAVEVLHSHTGNATIQYQKMEENIVSVNENDSSPVTVRNAPRVQQISGLYSVLIRILEP